MNEDENVENESSEMKTDMAPMYFPHFSYHYGYRFPKHVQQEKMGVEKGMNMEEMEKSRKKRDVVEPTVTYATYPRIVGQSYYPSNAVYYPTAVSSRISSVSLNNPKPSIQYHPSVAQVTRTIVKLPQTVVDNSIQGAEALITSDNSKEDAEPEALPEVVPEDPVEDAEPETVPEDEVVPEKEPVSNDVASSTAEKSTAQVIPVAIERPIYYPAQAVLKPDVANTRPAFHPHWGTRMTILPGTQYYPVPGQFYPLSGMNTKHVFKSLQKNVKSPVRE